MREAAKASGTKGQPRRAAPALHRLRTAIRSTQVAEASGRHVEQSVVAAAVATDAVMADLWPPVVRRLVAGMLLVVGMVISVGAAMRWLAVERAMRTSRPLPLSPLVPLLSLAVLLGAACALGVAIWWER
jgi:uncharacterized membrane protein YidH (DUF202 family)